MAEHTSIICLNQEHPSVLCTFRNCFFRPHKSALTPERSFHMKNTIIPKALVLSSFLLTSSALAHSEEHASGFAAGFGHPLSGTDHLLAMLAVGILAAPFGQRGLGMALAFVLAGCNTVQGVGQDIGKAGNAIQRAAQ